MVFYLPSSEFDIIPNIISKQPTVLLCFLQDHNCIPWFGKKLVLFWIAQHISVLFSSVICGLTSSSLFHVFLADIWKTDGRSEDSAAPKLYHLLWERDRLIKWIKRENYIPTAAACPKLAAASLAEGLPSRETSCLNVETGTGGSSSFSCTAFGFQQEAPLDIDQMHEKKKKKSVSHLLFVHTGPAAVCPTSSPPLPELVLTAKEVQRQHWCWETLHCSSRRARRWGRERDPLCTVSLLAERRQAPYGLFKENRQPLVYNYTEQPDEVPGVSAILWPRVPFCSISACTYALGSRYLYYLESTTYGL